MCGPLNVLKPLGHPLQWIYHYAAINRAFNHELSANEFVFMTTYLIARKATKYQIPREEIHQFGWWGSLPNVASVVCPCTFCVCTVNATSSIFLSSTALVIRKKASAAHQAADWKNLVNGR